jgi:hypothetical protein
MPYVLEQGQAKMYVMCRISRYSSGSSSICVSYSSNSRRANNLNSGWVGRQELHTVTIHCMALAGKQWLGSHPPKVGTL